MQLVRPPSCSSLHPIACPAATIRGEWAKWNPQREAARALEEAIRIGSLTLEVGAGGAEGQHDRADEAWLGMKLHL